ncbi:hypothetical protein ScPMuIL_000829 [Solemya velum]
MSVWLFRKVFHNFFYGFRTRNRREVNQIRDLERRLIYLSVPWVHIDGTQVENEPISAVVQHQADNPPVAEPPEADAQQPAVDPQPAAAQQQPAFAPEPVAARHQLLYNTQSPTHQPLYDNQLLDLPELSGGIEQRLF